MVDVVVELILVEGQKKVVVLSSLLFWSNITLNLVLVSIEYGSKGRTKMSFELGLRWDYMLHIAYSELRLSVVACMVEKISCHCVTLIKCQLQWSD